MNEIREKRTNFFNNNTHYVLFSGTPKNGNGPIRHLNDLFIILYLINKNSIPRENVFLSIDTQILEDLDEVTSNKKFKYFESANKTFKEVIKEWIPKENIIDIFDFEENYKRDDKDLV